MAGTAILAAALVAGGSAEAAFAPGEYRGQTKAERPLSFAASKAKRKVTSFTIRVRYSCTDADTFWTTEDGFPAIRIRRGRFAGTFQTRDASYTATIRGAFDGRAAKGSYKAERRYDRNGNLDPRGRVICSVTRTAWTAKRR